MGDQSLDEKITAIENLLKVSLAKTRELKKALKDPDILKREMKRGIPEFEGALNRALEGYLSATGNQD